MFGYVRPVKPEMKVKEFEQFNACYCGFCHSLGKHYGVCARFILNYDYTFLSMLLSEDKSVNYEYKRCLVSPFKKKRCCADNRAYEIAGAHSVILTYWKLNDEILDSRFVKGTLARAGKLFLRRAYKRALAICGDFNEFAEERLGELAELEKNKSPVLDAAADKFALILSAAAENVENKERQKSLAELLYHTGRAVYLLDAYDDLERDIKNNSFNPIATRFNAENGNLTKAEQEYLSSTIGHSINIMCREFETLPETAWSGILKNIIYLGMPYMRKAVLSRAWQARKKVHRDKI